MAVFWWLYKSKSKTWVICTVITNTLSRKYRAILSKCFLAIWLHVVHGINDPLSWEQTMSQSYHLSKHLVLEEVAVNYMSETLPSFSPHAFFSKLPSCKVSTLPLFPDCYHNSLALNHQNISSYLLSKNSCFLSAISFFITKGENKWPAFIGRNVNVVSFQGNQSLILYLPMLIAFWLQQVSYQQSSLFFCEKFSSLYLFCKIAFKLNLL